MRKCIKDEEIYVFYCKSNWWSDSSIDSRRWNCGGLRQKALCIERMRPRVQECRLERTWRKRFGREYSRNRAAREYSRIFQWLSINNPQNMPFMPLTIKYDLICLFNLLNFKCKIKIIEFYTLPKHRRSVTQNFGGSYHRRHINKILQNFVKNFENFFTKFY